MAQLGARLNGIEKVVGSNPTGSTLTIEYSGFVNLGFHLKNLDRSSRLSARELGSPGENLNIGVCRTPFR